MVKRLSEEHKQKIGLALKEHYQKYPTRKHSEEEKIQVSQSLKEHYKHTLSPMLGRHLSEEHKQKISTSQKQPNYHNSGRFQKGHIPSVTPEIRKKLSETCKRLYAEGKIINPRKGVHLSDETKQKIGLAHLGMIFSKEEYPNMGMRGKHHSKEALEKMSKIHKGKRHSPQTEFKKGCIPWMKGRHLSEEQKRKLLLAHLGKKFPHTKEWNEKLRIANLGKHHHSEEALKKIKLARLKQVFPSKDTSIEVLMQKELRNRNIPFQTHFPILGQPDIVIQNGHNFAIFCDGCYWHSCPQCFPNGGSKSKKNDAQVTRYLQSRGWVVLRFWEHDIKNNLQECVDKISQVGIEVD